MWSINKNKCNIKITYDVLHPGIIRQVLKQFIMYTSFHFNNDFRLFLVIEKQLYYTKKNFVIIVRHILTKLNKLMIQNYF